MLLTSPQAANTVWVNREIEHWKANRSPERILPVPTDGRWQWDAEIGDFTADSDAVPPALRGVFSDEPRHLDLCWARQDEQLDVVHNLAGMDPGLGDKGFDWAQRFDDEARAQLETLPATRSGCVNT